MCGCVCGCVCVCGGRVCVCVYVWVMCSCILIVLKRAIFIHTIGVYTLILHLPGFNLYLVQFALWLLTISLWMACSICENIICIVYIAMFIYIVYLAWFVVFILEKLNQGIKNSTKKFLQRFVCGEQKIKEHNDGLYSIMLVGYKIQ